MGIDCVAEGITYFAEIVIPVTTIPLGVQDTIDALASHSPASKEAASASVSSASRP